MKRSKELTQLSPQEASIYFSSEWYKSQMKAKRLKLIELKIIKENRKLH